MFFKKELMDSPLICKLAKKKPRMSEEMLAITNKYSVAEEVAFDTRENDVSRGPDLHDVGSIFR
jgi:hypothetical protein